MNKRAWYIAGAVKLQGNKLFCRKRALELSADTPAALLSKLQAVPGVEATDCTNFRRGSIKVKEHLLAATALLYDSRSELNSKSAVLCCSRLGSHQQNLDYFQDYVEFGRTTGRGHLFVATIPTTPMCEAAIAIGAHGPAYYLDVLDDWELFYEDMEMLLDEDPEIPAVFAFFDLPGELYALLFRRGSSSCKENITPTELFDNTTREKSYCCVIPVYNNAGTIENVAGRALKVIDDVLVVDDGSTDADLRAKLHDLPLEVVRHEENRGKGAALLTALDILKERNIDYMITLDGDGQHFPEDIPLVIRKLEGAKEGTLLVGCRDFNDPNVPDSSRFGRAFSNFWMGVESGVSVDDCQSGFRAYPVKYVQKINCFSRHYNWETEILTRSAWAGLEIVNFPVQSYYPVREERISHFRPFKDNWRISLVHAMLILRRLLPVPGKKLIKEPKTNWLEFFHPGKFFRWLVQDDISPGALAAAAAVGTFLAVLPLLGLHGVVILYAAVRLHLNKLMAFNIQHFFMPPFTPFLCIELGYFLRHGVFLKEFTAETLFRQGLERIWEWLLGSLVLAPVFAVLTGSIVYGIAALCCNIYRRRRNL